MNTGNLSRESSINKRFLQRGGGVPVTQYTAAGYETEEDYIIREDDPKIVFEESSKVVNNCNTLASKETDECKYEEDGVKKIS